MYQVRPQRCPFIFYALLLTPFFRIAKELIHKIRAYWSANDLVAELVIRIEGIWVKTEVQIEALKSIRTRSNQRIQEFHEECYRRLQVKLYTTSAEIETVTDDRIETMSLKGLTLNHGSRQKSRYALLEGHLKNTIRELEAWHAVFDPSWFLIPLHKDEAFESDLQLHPIDGEKHEDVDVVVSIRAAIRSTEPSSSSSIFLGLGALSSDLETLQNSTISTATLASTGSKVIVDTTAYPGETDQGEALKHVRDLARVLSCSQPDTLGLLQCLGVLKLYAPNGALEQFQYIFALPRQIVTSPSSLRTVLQRDSPSLDDKYRIAQSLTRGVAAVHCSDFVHKNIRPDTTLVFHETAGTSTKTYLVGFERSRPASAGTSLMGDMAWERNLYRHPARQGIRPEHAYLMQYDIYNLGVCLLELGMWSSLVLSSEPPKPGSLLPIDDLISMKNSSKAAWEIKGILFDLASS